VTRAENRLCTWSPAPTSISCLSVWTPSAIFGDCCSIATKRFNVRQSNPATICLRYTVFTHHFVWSFFFVRKIMSRIPINRSMEDPSQTFQYVYVLYILILILNINIQYKIQYKKTEITNLVFKSFVPWFDRVVVTIQWNRMKRILWGRGSWHMRSDLSLRRKCKDFNFSRANS